MHTAAAIATHAPIWACRVSALDVDPRSTVGADATHRRLREDVDAARGCRDAEHGGHPNSEGGPMGFDQYHEPPEELPQATRTFARLCASLTEEAEAIGW